MGTETLPEQVERHTSFGPDDELQREEHVHQLARQMSHLSRTNTGLAQDTNPFLDNSSPTLNPNSPKFDARAWMKHLVHLASKDSETHHHRTAGVSFTNLSVHGFGTPTDYQKDVGNLALSLFGSVKRLLGFKKSVRKIQILRDFDGLVKHGEMLIVLGRPGS